jgi:hypothetical protein
MVSMGQVLHLPIAPVDEQGEPARPAWYDQLAAMAADESRPWADRLAANAAIAHYDADQTAWQRVADYLTRMWTLAREEQQD